MKKTKPFFQKFDHKVPYWIQEGEEYIRKNFGKPCNEYSPSCWGCRAWQAWATLHEMTNKDS